MAEPYVFGDRIEQVVTWHAQRRPGAIALEFDHQQITYGELVGTASGLARALAGLGVGPGEVVPIVAVRSPELVYAVLGVLLAGAVYAVVDPVWPMGRINEVIDRLDAKVVLVDRADRIRSSDSGARPNVQIATIAHPSSEPWV